MTVGFDVGFDAPFFGGSVSTSFEAGIAYPVSLGGVPYLLDTKGYEFSHSSVPLMRAASDDKDNAGRQTLNPESFWRRTFESWHFGAGQTHFDRVSPFDESNPFRFRRSKGVDVWDRYELSLLNGTDAKALFTSTNPFMAVAGGFLYMTDGTLLKRTADIAPDVPTLTTITGTPAATASAIASDGFNVLTAHGASGIYRTTRGAATTASNITGTVQQVAHGKGRWIATNGPALYDITTLVGGGPVALPTALFTHPNSDWVWNSFAEGPTAFYVGGFSGDKSLIYRLTMKEDGTGLNQPVVAGFLPDGELIYSMQGYLGFVLIGTSNGVRVGVVGGNGDLTIGAFIPTDSAVRCFEGQGTYVWFGWSDYEAVDAGLGRINMETFTDTDALAPAYASDLMANAGLGTIRSVVTFQDRRVFSSDLGSASVIYAEEPGVLVATGQIDSGVFDYGITDEKISLFIDTSHPGTHGGSHSLAISLDGAPFVSLGEFSHGNPVATGEARGHIFELRVTLNRDAVDTSTGAELAAIAMRSHPAVALTEQIVVPLLIAPTVQRRDGMSVNVNTTEQRDHIRGLRQSQQIVQYVEGAQQWSVIVADFQLDVKEVYVAEDQSLGINGTCLVRLKVVN